MRYQICGIENAAGSRFCNLCGTPLNKRCPKCGSENAPEAIFCSQCGTAIDAAGRMRAAEPRGDPAEPRGSSLTGERRHLTLLFCDLVNSTSLAARLDPEEWRETVADYHRAAAQAIERFGGHVAEYQGDGVPISAGPRPTTTMLSEPHAPVWRLSMRSPNSTSIRRGVRGRSADSIRCCRDCAGSLEFNQSRKLRR
jgi:class 3 adenylate cyclase